MLTKLVPLTLFALTSTALANPAEEQALDDAKQCVDNGVPQTICTERYYQALRDARPWWEKGLETVVEGVEGYARGKEIGRSIRGTDCVTSYGRFKCE